MMNSELSSRELRERVDKLWTQFWTGGIANPLSVIEQITFLMFARLLDITEARNENRARRSGKPFRRIFAEDQQDLRWSQFKNLPGAEMLALVRDKVFPHFRTVALEGAKFGEYMKDDQLLIVKPNLLVEAVNMIEAAADGGWQGFKVAANVMVQLIVFIGLVSLANMLLAKVLGQFGVEWRIQDILGVVLR